jgi:transposase
MVFKGRFTSPVFIGFLRRLLRHTQRPVFLIVDEHPVHRSAMVKQWVARPGARLRLFFLPGYSPELNPDEYLSNDVKANAVGRQRPHNEGELMANVRGYLRSTQRRPQKVRRYFHHPSVRYAASVSNIIRSA